MKSIHSPKKGFTLIELLVVIAIIAILAAILFPVFAQAKRAAKSAATLSNVKQLSVSAKLYATDSDDTTVMTQYFDVAPWHGWSHLIQPYMKNESIMNDVARRVPEYNGVRTFDPGGGAEVWQVWAWNVNIGINRYGYGSERNYIRTETSFEDPSARAAFMVHGPATGATAAQGLNRGHFVFTPYSMCANYGNYRSTTGNAFHYNWVYQAAVDYHANGIITAFADGSAKKIPVTRVTFDNRDFGGDYNCAVVNNINFQNTALVPNQKQADALKYWGKYYDLSF
jgi:prepilin-type N-terminal cleavage/methylation domain-containing protein